MSPPVRPLVIYHKNCSDGFTAAWVTVEHLFDLGCDEEGIELLAVAYGYEPPEDIAGRDIWIVDFSYSREQLLAMKEQARSLLVIDHHKTAAEALKGLSFCVFDMDECGASLAWKTFNPTLHPPWLVRYVRDRDLWRWELRDSKAVSAVIALTEHNLEDWTRLFARLEWVAQRANVITQGELLLKQQARHVALDLKRAQDLVLAGQALRVVNASTHMSEVANELAGDKGVGACWVQASDGRYHWSFRSEAVDVSRLAQRLGGGGHRAAAGARIDVDLHRSLLDGGLA